MAYYAAVSNPFLKLVATSDMAGDQPPFALVGGAKWKGFRRRVDEISRLVGAATPVASA